MTSSSASAVAVEKAVDVLDALADSEELTLAEVTQRVGYGKTAVLRILNALVRKGLVQQDARTGVFSLSWGALAIARSLANRDLPSLARPHMVKLRDLTEETVTLNARVGFQRICVEQVEGLHELRWRVTIGSLGPLYGGSTGEMFLASFDAATLENYFEAVELPQTAPGSEALRPRLRRDIQEIRALGYCHDAATLTPGVSGISAPIHDASSAPVAVMTIAGPEERFANVDGWVEALLASTGEISRLLGYRDLAEAGAPVS